MRLEDGLKAIVRAIEELHETVAEGVGDGSEAGGVVDGPGTAGAQAKGGGSSIGSGIPGPLRTLAGAAALGTVAKGLGAAGDDFISGGDASSAGGAFDRSISRVASNVPLLGRAFGAAQSTGILDRTQSAVGGIASSLAQAGITPTKSQLRGLVARRIKVEERVEKANIAVEQEVNRQARGVRDKFAPDLEIPGFEKLADVIDKVSNKFRQLERDMSGGSRRRP